MNRLPAILFCVVALFFFIIGVVDIGYDRFQDLPWDASFSEGIADPSEFDRPIEILTNWIGVLLIIGASTLAVLAANLRNGSGYIIAAGILSIGILLGQLTTLWTIGAPRLLLTLPSTMLMLSLLALTLAWRQRTDA